MANKYNNPNLLLQIIGKYEIFAQIYRSLTHCKLFHIFSSFKNGLFLQKQQNRRREYIFGLTILIYTRKKDGFLYGNKKLRYLRAVK